MKPIYVTCPHCGEVELCISKTIPRGIPLYEAIVQDPRGKYCHVDVPPHCGYCNRDMASSWDDIAELWT